MKKIAAIALLLSQIQLAYADPEPKTAPLTDTLRCSSGSTTEEIIKCLTERKINEEHPPTSSPGILIHSAPTSMIHTSQPKE